MGTAFFDADNDGDLDLYVVSGGSEFNEGSDMYQDRLYLNDGKGNFSKSITSRTLSAVVPVLLLLILMEMVILIFSVDGEVVPHKYPKPPRSYLLVNEKGKFVDKTNRIST